MTKKLPGVKAICPQKVNFAQVKRWINFCTKNHSPEKCRLPSIPELPGFYLIDCWTRSLVTPPQDCQYITLSYVWGQKTVNSSLEGSLPSVIQGSISVTMALGYRYLWVDRYCIDQTSEHKHLQIAQIDRIYSQSVLTIIAAAGHDSDYGLPGVSLRHRHQQEKLKLADFTLIRVPPPTAYTLGNSPWLTRGWTYQEGFLAQRRLIFTDDEVSFVCNQMYCSELNNQPADSIPHASVEPFLLKNFPDHFNLGFGAEEVGYYVRNFTSKNLSYPSDSLTACLGILGFFERWPHCAYHLFGVLLRYGGQSRDINLGLGWYHDDPALRRPGLPSWS
ncbi:HET-domain-containing protein [Podospora fimiseda]|uniref:HET-domain-containing protein n=1 Tax=Podospora fimiseda TaxID=252190 RepID=A0AAN7BIQ2_9PEZI|nr:HET-domain-containing protein [Podospora fimiseda]